ncbi:hypothetical protein ACFOU2_18290 [Bacillus songklensis]|uniref:Uncharacterized protein n=1 Tax=Bacillus songklensis TaxID=1069116 RepID=A0ABV8B805_9BACI
MESINWQHRGRFDEAANFTLYKNNYTSVFTSTGLPIGEFSFLHKKV